MSIESGKKSGKSSVQGWRDCQRAAEHRSRLERLEQIARNLYEVWRHRAGAPETPFEYLKDRQAWFDVAQAALDIEAECKCGAPLPMTCQACADLSI